MGIGGLCDGISGLLQRVRNTYKVSPSNWYPGRNSASAISHSLGATHGQGCTTIGVTRNMCMEPESYMTLLFSPNNIIVGKN